MSLKHTLPSCPALCRASTIFLSKCVDGREKPGHDGVAWRGILASVFLVAASSQALAHPSVVAHEHPHDASVLPDLGAMLLAALLVGAVFAARQLLRRG